MAECHFAPKRGEHQPFQASTLKASLVFAARFINSVDSSGRSSIGEQTIDNGKLRSLVTQSWRYRGENTVSASDANRYLVLASLTPMFRLRERLQIPISSTRTCSAPWAKHRAAVWFIDEGSLP